MSRMLQVVAFACALTVATADKGIPAELEKFLPGEGEEKERPAFPGMKEIGEVGAAWANDAPGDLAAKKALCQKIDEGLTAAADTDHDLFNGLRLFATSCKKSTR